MQYTTKSAYLFIANTPHIQDMFWVQVIKLHHGTHNRDRDTDYIFWREIEATTIFVLWRERYRRIFAEEQGVLDTARKILGFVWHIMK
jgi:hypothetical protein